MKDTRCIIEEDCFQYPKSVFVRNYGDEFDPYFGFESFELTKEDIEALLDGKVLETDSNEEYGILIRMKRTNQ